MVFIGVDLDQIDKMAPRRVKSAPGPIELNQHFGAKTDLLVLECIHEPQLKGKKEVKHSCHEISYTEFASAVIVFNVLLLFNSH